MLMCSGCRNRSLSAILARTVRCQQLELPESAAVLKNTMWGNPERYNIQFRIEMFNAFNHPSLGAPNTGFTSGRFGVISGFAGNARWIDVTAKFTF